jgi:beta-carotene hydroxylase
MLPRNSADYRTVLWALVMPVVALVQYRNPDLISKMWWVSAYFAVSASVIAHNHNHCPTFASKRMNAIFANWISFFYGYPTFAWIPTHNLNHHRYVNKAGDATITWRHTNKNNALVASTYFFVSSYFQSFPIQEFIRKAKKQNPKLYRTIMNQYVFFVTAHASALALACMMHGFKKGLYVWGCTLALPALFALWTVMFFNYGQHVHTDPWSAHNHSRTFDGWLLNFLLFNNGLHTAHHENASAHWSTLPSAYAKVKDEIHPELRQRSFWWWVMKTYFLSLLVPSLGTQQIGRAPFDAPSGEKVRKVRTATVGDAVEAGVNAQMI